jgi:serine/threonine-protein kinase
MPELAPGAVVAGHRLDEFVARGGMGVVWRVTHLSLGTERALKLIAPEFASDEAFRERFRREWRIAASIDHPHVIPIHDAGEADGLLYIAMRYVDGTDLRQLILKDGALDPQLAATIVSQVGSALDAAHARGLIHRDIKPANIVIESVEGRPHAYLTDFGLSKLGAGVSGVQLTETGHWVGTVDYVAPEQIEAKPVDARTDVYALGCVAFQALSGEVPFPKDSDIAKIWAHMNDPPPSLGERAPHLPGDLDAVVLRAMAKAPEDRYQSAGELGDALAAATGAVTAAAGATPAQPTAKRSRAPKARRGPRRVPALGMVLAVLIAAIVLVVLVTGGGSGGGGGGDAAPAGATLVEYQQQVGDICAELNRTNRKTARRARPYQKRLNRAKDLTALRNVIVEETQQRIGTASSLRASLVGLEPPDAAAAARQRDTARAWERNVAAFQAYRDRLKDVRNYDDLVKKVRAFDKRRTSVERTSADVRAGLERLGGPACRLQTPPVSKPVSMPADPEAAKEAEASSSSGVDTQPPASQPAPDTQPPPVSSPPPDTNPPAPATPPSPDTNPPQTGAPPPDATPPISGGGGGGGGGEGGGGGP